MTKAQKWARERNSDKFVLTGIRGNLESLTKRNDSLLATERKELRRAILLLDETLNCWKGRNTLSKKKYMEGK